MWCFGMLGFCSVEVGALSLAIGEPLDSIWLISRLFALMI